MNIKKRLFYSNLLMVIMPLVATSIIGTIFFFIGSAIFSSTDKVDVMNQSFVQIQGIIDKTDGNLLLNDSKAQNSLMDKFSKQDIEICGMRDGNILFSSLDTERQTKVLEYFNKDNLHIENQTLWIVEDDFFLFSKNVQSNTYPITLIAIGDPNLDDIKGVGNTAMFILILLLVILTVVVVIMQISMYLANRMIKRIMIPLDHLCDGAQRIQDGNLDEDIYCEGTEELEKVCETFNEMQHQLKENVKKNEIYERDRNEMLAGISHDLRTPLTSIKSYVKGLQDDIAKTPDKQKEYLEVVYRKACRIEELINSLFLFSKLKTGKFPFNFKLVPIQNFIITLLDLLEDDIKKGNASLILKSNCVNQKVRIDGEQMTRAINNIIDNCLKYNKNRRIHITVNLEERDGSIIISIQDDGIGVPEEKLVRLFDSFYRGDESRNNTTEGSGLGLAIAKNIVTANNGKIYAESQDGLTIIIELPVEKEENQ